CPGDADAHCRNRLCRCGEAVQEALHPRGVGATQGKPVQGRNRARHASQHAQPHARGAGDGHRADPPRDATSGDERAGATPAAACRGGPAYANPGDVQRPARLIANTESVIFAVLGKGQEIETPSPDATRLKLQLMFRKAHPGRSCSGLPDARAHAVCAAAIMWAAMAIGLSARTFAQTPETSAAQVSEAVAAQTPETSQAGAVQRDSGTPPQSSGMPVGPAALPGPTITKRQRREAESAYMDGAKKLDRDELEAAQRAFEHAAMLDPGNGSYATAAIIARQHRIVELVRKVSQARSGGDENKAQSLLEQARAIDPGNPLVLEHVEPPMSLSNGQTHAGIAPLAATPIADAEQSSAQQVGAGEAAVPWSIVPNAAGPIHLAPTRGTQSFNLGGDSYDVIRRLFQAYGIKTALDGSVEHKNLRFNMEEVNYTQAVTALTAMTNILLVPVDETTVLVAKNDNANRTRLERQLEETVYLPGLATDEFNETVQLLKGIFDKATFTPQPTRGAIVVRAPESVIGALNQTVQGLQEARGEILVEVRLYEVDTTKTLKAGANIPNAFGIYNVDQAAAQLVQQNASLVQQAIAQGLISPTASNFEIAAALIGSGLVKSSLLNSTIGIFGGGITQTGITETGSLGIN